MIHCEDCQYFKVIIHQRLNDGEVVRGVCYARPPVYLTVAAHDGYGGVVSDWHRPRVNADDFCMIPNTKISIPHLFPNAE